MLSIRVLKARLATVIILVLLTFAAPLRAQTPAGSAFTYQGLLTQSGNPATGVFDLRFTLFNSATAGAQVGAVIDKADVSVTNGRFTVDLDFGAAALNGQARWLQIAVRPGASTGAFTPLAPRQPLTPAPYAITALSALTAGSAQSAVTAATANRATTATIANTAKSVPWSALTGVSPYISKSGADRKVSTSTSATLELIQNGSGKAAALRSAGRIGLESSTAITSSTNGSTGVLGYAGLFSGDLMQLSTGVFGEALDGTGVFGRSASDFAYGVHGQNAGTYPGVYGESWNGTGVLGTSDAIDGYGGHFQGDNGIRAEGFFGYAAQLFGISGAALFADGSATVTQNLNVGGTLTAADIRLTNPRIRHLNVHASAFFPRNSIEFYGADPALPGRFAIGASSTLTAPFNLPDGAVITGIQALVADSSAGSDLSVLVQKYLTTDNETLTVGAASTTASSPNNVTLEITLSDPFDIVNNADGPYFIDVFASPSWDNQNTRIINVRITYTLQE